MNKYSARFSSWLFLAFLLVASPARVQSRVAPPDMLDGARLIYETEIAAGDYQLVTSSIKKINGQWRAEKLQLVTGSIKRATYELKPAPGFRQVERQLLDFYKSSTAYRLVFNCDGLDCGSSSGWANEFLNVKQLFGLDSFQNYSVWETGNPERRGYVVLYLVQRGNKRTYLQWDQITLGADASATLQPEAVEQALASTGHYRVPDFSLDPDGAPRISDRSVAVLRAYFARNQGKRMRLVGHAYDGGELKAEQEKSRLYAAFVLQSLREAGVATDTISVHGVGSLAPAGLPTQARVELIAGN